MILSTWQLRGSKSEGRLETQLRSHLGSSEGWPQMWVTSKMDKNGDVT